jgi:hypothetical protein
VKPAQQTRIDQSFARHKPATQYHDDVCHEITNRTKYLATFLANVCPDGRQLNSALKYLEEAQYFAIQSILVNQSTTE